MSQIYSTLSYFYHFQSYKYNTYLLTIDILLSSILSNVIIYIKNNTLYLGMIGVKYL